MSGDNASSGGFGWIVVGLLVGVAAVFAWQRFAPDFGDRDQDRQEQRDDDRDATPASKGKTLVFVHERNPQPIEHDLLLRQMDSYTRERGLQYRALDDDLRDDQVAEAIAFAKSKGVESPFVLLTDANDRPAKVIKWPATIDELGELFK